jgi:hypothetical protein
LVRLAQQFVNEFSHFLIAHPSHPPRQPVVRFQHDVAVFVPQFVNVVPTPLKGVVNQLAHEPSLLSQGFFVAVIRLRNFRRCARYGELFKASEPSEPVVRAVFGLSVFPSVRENERRKQGSKVDGQKDDGVGAV